MIHGTLVTNAFLRTDKFVEHYVWLKKAAQKYNMELSLRENGELLPVLGEDREDVMTAIARENDFVLYWDKDIPVGKLLEQECRKENCRIFNSIDGIGHCDDKFKTYYLLQQWNQTHPSKKIPIIPTIVAPMTYANIGYTKMDFVEKVIERLGLPLVIKECFGSFGMQVYLAKDREEVYAYTKKLAGSPFLYEKFMEESKGRDLRLQVVGDQVVAAMERCGQHGDFRANITNGGTMKKYQPSKKECQLAVRTCKALQLDFAGVDLLFGGENKQEERWVCEVNSNAHFKNIHTCTGVNVAEKIMEYISKEIENPQQEESRLF